MSFMVGVMLVYFFGLIFYVPVNNSSAMRGESRTSNPFETPLEALPTEGIIDPDK